MNEQILTTLARIKQDRPPVHIKKDGSYRCVGLSNEVLDFLLKTIEPGANTLETGCGLSTLLFALADCNHIAIAPNSTHIEETKKVAAQNQISLDKVTFVEKRSEHFLPMWSTESQLDTILIDGGHAFPLAILDWFYTQQHLRQMGYLILDDIGLQSVHVLFEFLKEQPEWEVLRIIHKTAFFRKLTNLQIENEWDYWHKQSYNRSIKTKIRQVYYGVKHRLRF